MAEVALRHQRRGKPNVSLVCCKPLSRLIISHGLVGWPRCPTFRILISSPPAFFSRTQAIMECCVELHVHARRHWHLLTSQYRCIKPSCGIIINAAITFRFNLTGNAPGKSWKMACNAPLHLIEAPVKSRFPIPQSSPRAS